MALSVKFERTLDVRASDAYQTLSVQCLSDNLVDSKFDGPEQKDYYPRNKLHEAMDQPVTLVDPYLVFKDILKTVIYLKIKMIKLDNDKETNEKKHVDFY